MNLRRSFLILALTFAVPAPVSLADISGHSSAVCGGVLMTVDELERSIAEGFAPTGFAPLSFAEPNLEAFAKQLEGFDEKATKEAREKIAAFRARTEFPGVRTSAILFSGDGATALLKSSVGNARAIGAQAGKNPIFKKWLIGAFGARSLLSLAAIPQLLDQSSDKWWYIIPAALIAVEFGRPVVQSLLRMRKSPLEKFMIEEFAKVGVASKAEGLHILSMTGKSTTDFKTLVTVEENARAPWAQQMVFSARPYGATRMKRVFRWKNPLVIPRQTSHIDLIAMPYGPDRQRQILVLTAEGI